MVEWIETEMEGSSREEFEILFPDFAPRADENVEESQDCRSADRDLDSGFADTNQ